MSKFVKIGKTLVNSDKIITVKEEEVLLDGRKQAKLAIRITFENGNELIVDPSVCSLEHIEFVLNEEKKSTGSSSTSKNDITETHRVEDSATTPERTLDEEENNTDKLQLKPVALDDIPDDVRLKQVARHDTPDWIKNLGKEGKSVTQI